MTPRSTPNLAADIMAAAATVPHAVAIPVEDTARRAQVTARPAVNPQAVAAATEAAEVEAAIMAAVVDPTAAAPMVAAEVTLADTGDNREIHPGVTPLRFWRRQRI